MSTAPTTYSIRPYQDQMIGAAYASLKKGTNRVLEKAPTGTGKTVTFASLLADPRMLDWLSQFPGKSHALVIAHREELLDQAAEKIRAINPTKLVSIEQGERMANLYSDVVVASIQTLAARDCRRLFRLLSGGMQFRIVIVDEAHHAAARTYRQVFHHLGFLPSLAAEADDKDLADEQRATALENRLAHWDAVAPKDRLLLGVTATPNRSDSVGLSCVFQTIAFSYALKDAINDGYLVPIVAHTIETDTSLDNVRTTAGEFNQKDLAETVNTPQRNAEAVAAWKHLALRDGAARPTIGFTVDVQHAHDAADMFQRAGIRAMPVSGETPKEDRRLLLRQFSEGQLDMLLNCMVLTEGTDLPRASAILHLKPTRSATLYEQMTGRGLRLFPGKEDCLVIDMVDIASKHTLQAAPMLYGLPPMLDVQGKTLREAEEEFDRLREGHEGVDFDALLKGVTSLGDLGKKLATLNVWNVEPLPEGILAASTLDWVRNGEVLRLSYPWLDGNESLLVQKDMLGHWDVVTTFRPRDSHEVRQRTIVTGVRELLEATVRAEQYVATQRGQVVNMKRRDASWKGAPATPKQKAFLQRLKVPFNPQTISKGEAGRLIDVAMARKGR